MALFDHLFDQVLGDDPTAGLISEPASLLNTVVVEDRRLAALDRATDRPLRVTVINSTGAGGITALAGRSLTNCRTAAVQSAVRDPGDPVGNIARIAAAARELDPDVTLLVDIPDGFGFEDAVAAAEAEGLTAVTGPATPEQLAVRLSAFVEADLPFVIGGVGSPAISPEMLISLLAAVDSLVEEADVDAAAALLAGTDHDRQVDVIKGWDDARAGRVRRRLRAVRTCDPIRMIAGLTESGLIDPS